MNEVPGRDPYGNAAADYANLSFEYRAQGKFHLARAAGLRAMRMGWSEKVAEVSREALSKYPLDGDDMDVFEKLNEGAKQERNDSLGGPGSSSILGNIGALLFVFWPVLLPMRNHS